MIHAPLSGPKAICHAGSSDWKYSSGWKNVLILSALRIRKATRNNKTSWDVAASCARSKARRRYDFASRWESVIAGDALPIFVNASDAGVVGVDIGLGGSDHEERTERYVNSMGLIDAASSMPQLLYSINYCCRGSAPGWRGVKRLTLLHSGQIGFHQGLRSLRQGRLPACQPRPAKATKNRPRSNVNL